MVAAWGRKPGDRPRSIPNPAASSSFFSRPRSECIWSSRLQGAGLQLQPSDRISTGNHPQIQKNNNPVFGCAWVQNIWSGPTVHRCPEHISGGSGGSGSCGGSGGDALKSQVTLPSSAPRRLEPCSNLPSELAGCLSTDSQQVDEQFDRRSTNTDSSRKQTGSLRSSLLGCALVQRQSQLRQQQLRASVSGARLSHDKPPVSKVLLPVEPVRVKPRRNPLMYIIPSSQRDVK